MSQAKPSSGLLIIRRGVAVLLLLTIIPTTVTAFWLFNTLRVGLDPNTYKTSLNSRPVYNDLLGALLGGFVSNGAAPRHADVLLGLVTRGNAAADLFPSDYAQQQINSAVNQLNEWLSGNVDIPNIAIDLTPLKANLTGVPGQQAVADVLKVANTCRSQQDIDRIKNFSDSDSFDKLPTPICVPSDPALVSKLQSQLAVGLGSLAAVLPDSWRLADDLNNLAQIAQNNPRPNIGKGQHIDMPSLAQARVNAWLLPRLMVLLFLIPIALMCVIVIVVVRSSKSFFRWLSWALILSGFVSIIPIILIVISGLSAQTGEMDIISSASSIGEIALNSLTGSAVHGILGTLVLGVLIQVAILIVIGLVAAFLSILVSGPEPVLSDADLEALIAAQSGTAPAAS